MQTLTLGPFAVEPPDGVLRPRAPSLRPALRFAWRGRQCEAAMDREDGVRITAIAARVPSTADHGADIRRGTLAALAELPASLPAGWRVALTPDHRIRLEAPAPFGAGRPPTAVALIAAMVRFCLALDPYLDWLDELPGGSSGGTARTCPG